MSEKDEDAERAEADAVGQGGAQEGKTGADKTPSGQPRTRRKAGRRKSAAKERAPAPGSAAPDEGPGEGEPEPAEAGEAARHDAEPVGDGNPAVSDSAGSGETGEADERPQSRSYFNFAPVTRRFRRLPSLWRATVSDGPEMAVYIAALIGGSAFICLVKLFNLLGAWPVVVLSALAITAYAILVLSRREYLVRLDRYGDNCYYLGLTYTLVSMFVALVKLRPGVAPDELIGAFGIALGSTIVGIIWRLILIQLRSEADDVETQARLELAAASDRLRSQLDHAASRFQSFAFAIQGMVKESVVSLTDDQIGRQKELIEHFTTVLEGSVTSISRASEGIEASLARHSQIAERFDAASTHSVEAARSLAEKVEKVAIPQDLLTRSFIDISKTLNESAAALKESIASLRGATTAVGGASTHLAGFANNSKQALDAFEGFSAAAQGVSGSMQAMIAAIDKGASQVSDRNAALDSELARLKELTEGYAASLADVASFLADKISGHASQR